MSQDLRRYSRQTNVRLFIGFFLLLFLVGDGLIYIFLGGRAAIAGLICILAGTAPLLLIALVFYIIELVIKRNRED